MKEVFIVSCYNVYDIDYNHNRFVIGVGSTYEEAVNIIKDDIKNVACSYFGCRYEIEEWELDSIFKSGWTQAFSKEQNIEWAKELGVYNE